MKFEKFSEITDTYDRSKLQCINDHGRLITDVEEALRFQYSFNVKIADFLDNNYDEKNQFANKIAVSHGLFSRSIQLLYAMHQSTLHGIITASNNIGRTIYESILAQYYIGLYDDDMSKYLKEKHPDYKGQITYSHNFFKQKLYEGSIFDQMNNFYKIISSFSHADSYTLIDYKYDGNRVRETFNFFLTLSLFNILSYAQLYSYMPQHLKMIKDQIQPFIDERLMQSNYKIAPFFPNKKEIIDKILWNA